MTTRNLCFAANMVLALLVFFEIAAPFLYSQTKATEVHHIARNAHLAARGLIQTLSCQVKFKITILGAGDKKTTEHSCSSQYWYSPKALRVKMSDGDGEFDHLFKDNILKTVARRSGQGNEKTAATQRAYVYRFQLQCDAWVRGLLALHHPNTINYLPYEQLAEKASRMGKSEYTRMDGKEFAAVDLVFSGGKPEEPAWNVRVYFDPAINYMIRKVRYDASDGSYTRTEEVLEFAEPARGIYFPKKVVSADFDGGKPFSTANAEISGIRINQPLPDGVFDLRYQPGLLLVDSVRGTSYRVDAQGNPISKETSTGRGSPRTTAEDAPSGSALEKPRNVNWILIVLICVVTIGALVVIARTRKRKVTSN